MNPGNSEENADKKLELANEKLIRNEKILIQAYKSLKQKEEKLKTLNNDLCASEEELQTTNEELQAINDELYDKNNIIKKKNSELNTALKNLKQTQAQLFQADKMASLGVLTAGVAHEINNPLNYIMGAYFGLKEYFEDKNITEEKIIFLLNSLLEGVEKATSIVHGLNKFSRENKSKTEECNLHEIIDNCLIMLNNQLKHRVSVVKNYTSTNFIILGNVGKLHQVFINLLTNASQAIPNEGTITITTQLKNNYAVVSITDNGLGISKENLHKIIDPFFTTKDPGKGTGLGLSISYNIIKEYGGTLNFESELSKGTTAKITIPLNN